MSSQPKEMGKWARPSEIAPTAPSPTAQPTASTSCKHMYNIYAKFCLSSTDVAPAAGSRFADRPATGAPRQQQTSRAGPAPTFRGQQLTWNAARDGPYRAPERPSQPAPLPTQRSDASRGTTGTFKPPQRPTYDQYQPQPLSSRRVDPRQDILDRSQSLPASDFSKAKSGENVDAQEDSPSSVMSEQPSRWQQQQDQPQLQHQSQWKSQSELQQRPGDSSTAVSWRDDQRTGAALPGDTIPNDSQEHDDFKLDA